MYRPTLTIAALALLAALPASAQDFGGVRLRNPGALLDRIEAADRGGGCRLSATSSTVGVNRAMGAGSLARQQLGTVAGAPGGCQPLVSTQVVAGVNLALGRGSAAEQGIDARAPRGVLATTTVARGVNIAAGARSAAGQRIFSQIGR